MTGRGHAQSPGWIVVLNGAPRSGKSSIAEVMQRTFEGPWMNLGVDAFSQHVTPPRYRPGMGLRPGGERQDIEALIPCLYAAFYDSVAAHSRHGLNVVVDAGHHDAYSRPLRILPDAARRLRGLPALLVGIRCSLEEIMRRRDAGQPGIYDLELDTTAMTPQDAAALIRDRLGGPPPSALRRLAQQD
jgi:chloramphenicol 3-O phosphotransferase